MQLTELSKNEILVKLGLSLMDYYGFVNRLLDL